MRLMNETPHLKAVYLGPLKALVQERLKDWNAKFVQKSGKKMVELTGEFTPDVRFLFFYLFFFFRSSSWVLPDFGIEGSRHYLHNS